MTVDPFDEPEHIEAVRCLADVPPVAPSAELFTRILSRLSSDAPVQLLIRTLADASFAPTRQPGVTIRMLHADRISGRFAAYLKLEPGAILHSHHHDGVEECVVLSGTVDVGGRLMRAGDYQRAEVGSPHAEQSSPDGCVLFLTGPLSLLEV